MGDTMDKCCLQNPLDIVEGVTHAGQAAAITLHTTSYKALITTTPGCTPAPFVTITSMLC